MINRLNLQTCKGQALQVQNVWISPRQIWAQTNIIFLYDGETHCMTEMHARQNNFFSQHKLYFIAQLFASVSLHSREKYSNILWKGKRKTNLSPNTYEKWQPNYQLCQIIYAATISITTCPTLSILWQSGCTCFNTFFTLAFMDH